MGIEKPSLEIAVQGTAAVAKLHVIRDNKYVFSTEPGVDQGPSPSLVIP